MVALLTTAGGISSGRCFVIKRTNRPGRDQTGLLVCREEAVIVLRASAARTAEAIASEWHSGVEGWATGVGRLPQEKNKRDPENEGGTGPYGGKQSG